MKKLISLMVVLLLSVAFSLAAEDSNGDSTEGLLPSESAEDAQPTEESDSSRYEQEFSDVIKDDIYDDVEAVSLDGDVGLTPDSSFYFLENFFRYGYDLLQENFLQKVLWLSGYPPRPSLLSY